MDNKTNDIYCAKQVNWISKYLVSMRILQQFPSHSKNHIFVYRALTHKSSLFNRFADPKGYASMDQMKKLTRYAIFLQSIDTTNILITFI